MIIARKSDDGEWNYTNWTDISNPLIDYLCELQELGPERAAETVKHVNDFLKVLEKMKRNAEWMRENRIAEAQAALRLVPGRTEEL